jgi:alpha-D-xyloside xylohydrolase
MTQPESHQFGGVLREFAGDWTPIFADSRKRYSYLTKVQSVRSIEGGAHLEVISSSGETVQLSLIFVTPAVFRLRMWLESEPPADSAMLVEGAHRTTEAQVSDEGDHIAVASEALRVTVRRDEWGLSVGPPDDRPVFEQRWEDRQIRGAVTLPTGYSRAESGRSEFHESFSLEPDEHLYGLGEHFGGFDRKGQRIVSWSRDPVGSLTSTACYINIPFMISSRGFGLFFHHSSKMIYELGNPALQTAAIRVGDPYLDYYFIYGPSPQEVVARYTELTGRPSVPPLWSFGIWWSRCMYRNRGQVESIVERLRELRIPGDVVHLDPLWLRGRKEKRLDGCHFEWDEEAFPDPEGFVRWLAERGFRLSLWEIPYVYSDSEMAREGTANGYFAREPDGGPARPLENPEETLLVDFTNPEASRWWQDKHRRFLRMGVVAFKPDYGEAVPSHATFADGRTGEQVHNLYPLLYNKAVYEIMQEERGEAMLFSRSGYAGSQRYPINWTGDAPCTWGGMAATLRAGLSLSMSGISMWSHDVGGFWNPRFFEPPDPTLYIRWAQFGLLSSHARFHGIRGREPWYYGEKAVEVVREFGKLRYRLLPYIYSLAREAAQTGLPVLRPLALQYPDDPVAATVDYEYLLGPDLLVVPVMNAAGLALVYLPEGEWRNWWTDEVQRGPLHFQTEVPIELLPLYARAGVSIPLGPEMDYVGEKEEPRAAGGA